MRPARRMFVLGIGGALLLAGCAGVDAPTDTAEPTPTDDVVVVEGLYDVGGYSLNLNCQGTGSPTIVYFHGSAFDPGASMHSASSLPALIREDYRICVYDRLGVGGSDDRPDLTTGTEAVRGLNALLGAAGIEPPYVLLGASFGGLLAYEYLMTYPDQVEGMLLLDAAFPDELTLEKFWPEETRLENEDWSRSAENINQFFVYTESFALRGGEPDIPVTYLRAVPETWTQGYPEYDAQILDVQEAYVTSFPRRELKEVESPHYMEAAVPTVIVEELKAVIAQI